MHRPSGTCTQRFIEIASCYLMIIKRYLGFNGLVVVPVSDMYEINITI